ncbi:hypothetical protein XvhCFBP2543_00390 [Xanthomonas vasicola]|uniref:Uncharacterized protein n=1 Tax=Xanthomonas vasicola TaxID=56459 RepID=A0ABD7SEU3_XANVA|nr:hypothetical protein NX81_021095 [Xanthomonas vasicola]KGR38886.1 hypothetical protein NX04_19540 [Xanthomonas vasicola]KGR47584.1 hypothetical protein NX05_02750 [Xanthomonas vasicola]KGR59463.1 hypothetical protein NX79_14945 [Xanthomonas vasicola]PPV04386.1 hypothetical protein XvhCFBP2543_00390 [Xanthomonas vasicola]
MFAIVSPRTLLLQLRAPCAFQFKPGNRTALKKIIDALPGAVSSPLAGPLAYKDVLAACPASGDGTAHSADRL